MLPLLPVDQEPELKETLGQGSWLTLEKLYYKDNKQVKRTWERVIRKSNRQHQDNAFSSSLALDAVDIHAILLTPEPELLLVIQYRPAIEKYCIEFPSGLIDQGEDPLDAAIREFQEETGYKVNKENTTIQLHKTPVSYEPGLTNSCCYVAQITLYDDQHQEQQQLEPDEWSLQTIRFPLKNLLTHLLDVERAHDGQLIIDSRVHAYASGIMAHDQFLGLKQKHITVN
ncbi:NUDIX hydrolase domain-like protein [Phascolomyces articulosus]|uniref:NUDIX hydrolase domain-like protein n=1 Tax=Phascolomyces articulosus TaxID=60185 RepID=A0AAD5K7D0_9FUNG|nr:NUDIX hydrolase domain-like protein [Phascolomyces articulosus]